MIVLYILLGLLAWIVIGAVTAFIMGPKLHENQKHYPKARGE